MGKLICSDLKEMFCMVLVNEEGWETTLEVKNKTTSKSIVILMPYDLCQ